MIFYLGSHLPHWLGRLAVPLFVSRRRLCRVRRLPRAVCSWALDSGGFSELSLFGEWRTDETQYVAEVRRWRNEVGQLSWAAAQDWMCEPFITAKTGKTVAEHQRLTVYNFLTLRMAASDLPWVPVLQGWEGSDYLRCVDLYAAHGVDLTREPLVGLGSVCRRQHTEMVEQLIFRLSRDGIRLHGFGFKVRGLAKCHDLLASSDSLAWSYSARRSPPLPGCTHKSCANCQRFALAWRGRLLDGLRPAMSRQLPLFEDLFAEASC